MYYTSILSPPFQGGVSCPKGHDGVVDLPFETASQLLLVNIFWARTVSPVFLDFFKSNIFGLRNKEIPPDYT